jgi:hypothetical protein
VALARMAAVEAAARDALTLGGEGAPRDAADATVAEVVEAAVPTEQNDADAVVAEHEAEADPNLVPVHAPESDELTEAKIEAENEKPAPAKKAAAKKPAAKKADAEAADADAAGESADK